MVIKIILEFHQSFGIGLRGSAATARLLLDSSVSLRENDLVKALCSSAIKDNHEVACEIIKRHANLMIFVLTGLGPP